LEDAHFYTCSKAYDEAILANVDGYYYAASRPVEQSLKTWATGGKTKILAQARAGFTRAYNAPSSAKLEADLKECAASCKGQSQTGIANVADVVFSKHNSYAITFGQPGAVHDPCPHIIIRSVITAMLIVWLMEIISSMPLNPSIHCLDRVSLVT